jgi:Tol biopolymer transport system component
MVAVLHRRIRCAVALVVLVTLAACGSGDGSEEASSPADAPPTVGQDEPWVVFQGVARGLTLARPGGSDVHTILEGETLHPDWSPDGAEIAYVRAENGPGQVWLTDPEGEDARPLLESYPAGLEDLYWDNPAWSRDGARIAMVGYDGDPNETAPARSVLAVVDVGTGELTVAGELALADGRLHSFPRWSPEGDALVMNVDHFTGEVWDGATVAVSRAGEGGWSPPADITEVGPFGRVDWHPGEDLIVFGDHDIGGEQSTDEPTNLFVIRPDGTERRPVTDFGPGEERATQPTWTSDGHILFTYVTGDGDLDRAIAQIDPDGSDLEVLVEPELVGQGNRPHPRLRPVAPEG